MKILQRGKAVLILIQFVITVTVVIIFMKFFNKYHWFFRRKWAQMQAKLLGYKLIINGKPDINAQMLLLNHQSLLDIVIIEGIYPQNVAWVAKKEIADMFFFGQILTLPKMIIIDRESSRSLVQIIKEAKELLKDDRVIAMFPEGTRGDGTKLLPFKQGAKIVAQKLNLLVQPAVITNTRNIVDSQNFLAKKGTVTITYLEPVNPKNDPNWFENMKTDMQKILDKEL
jgi:1-acyl-sn-glycerol-3-phosphate acyltransferase